MRKGAAAPAFETLPAPAPAVVDLGQLIAIAQPFLARIVDALNQPRVVEGPKFVTVERAAELLGLPAGTVKRLRKEGKLPAIRAGQRWMFLRSAVEEWKP